jgi:hypothetical protein
MSQPLRSRPAAAGIVSAPWRLFLCARFVQLPMDRTMRVPHKCPIKPRVGAARESRACPFDSVLPDPQVVRLKICGEGIALGLSRQSLRDKIYLNELTWASSRDPFRSCMFLTQGSAIYSNETFWRS